jgi:hypothetical protein
MVNAQTIHQFRISFVEDHQLPCGLRRSYMIFTPLLVPIILQPANVTCSCSCSSAVRERERAEIDNCVAGWDRALPVTGSPVDNRIGNSNLLFNYGLG